MRSNAMAQYNFGLMYSNGDGVSQDDGEAVKWFRLAAEGSNVSACSDLSDINWVASGFFETSGCG
jgi:uncharacterized protein